MQAAACRDKAETDPLNCDHWLDQSLRWLERAAAPEGPVWVTIDLRPATPSAASVAPAITDDHKTSERLLDPRERRRQRPFATPSGAGAAQVKMKPLLKTKPL